MTASISEAFAKRSDVFDMYYLKDVVDKNYLLVCLTEFIIDDPGMRQNRISDMVTRLEKTFNNRMYVSRIQTSDKNWLEIDPKIAMDGIVGYMNKFLED